MQRKQKGNVSVTPTACAVHRDEIEGDGLKKGVHAVDRDEIKKGEGDELKKGDKWPGGGLEEADTGELKVGGMRTDVKNQPCFLVDFKGRSYLHIYQVFTCTCIPILFRDEPE